MYLVHTYLWFIHTYMPTHTHTHIYTGEPTNARHVFIIIAAVVAKAKTQVVIADANQFCNATSTTHSNNFTAHAHWTLALSLVQYLNFDHVCYTFQLHTSRDDQMISVELFTCTHTRSPCPLSASSQPGYPQRLKFAHTCMCACERVVVNFCVYLSVCVRASSWPPKIFHIFFCANCLVIMLTLVCISHSPALRIGALIAEFLSVYSNNNSMNWKWVQNAFN